MLFAYHILSLQLLTLNLYYQLLCILFYLFIFILEFSYYIFVLLVNLLSNFVFIGYLLSLTIDAFNFVNVTINLALKLESFIL